VVKRALASLALLSAFGCNALLGIDDHGLAPEPVTGDSTDVTGDGGAEAGPPGCFVGAPSTDLDFFNQCTNSEYVPFDNCARVGLCTSQVPPLVSPPGPATDAGTAAAAPRPVVGCYDATARPNLLFIQGSTNFTPFIQAMAPLVATSGYVVVWQPTASCSGAGAGGFDTASGGNLMTNPATASGAYASFYDATGTATPCLLGNSPRSPDGVSEITDIGESDVFAESCPAPAGQQAWDPGSAAYPDVGHYLGPIQAMVFVVPASSTQDVISAEAARLVFGTGGDDGMSLPWTDPTRMFIRGPGTGTNIILSRAIGVPSGQWWGVDTGTASAMQTVIVTTSTSDAERTIGTLSVDYADPVKNGLRILYFQAAGQLAGFLPDSAPNASDKQNVRDGHYSPWGPIHLYTTLVAGQASAQAAAFILPFTVPNQTLIDATIAGGAVPVCAMHVSRNEEMGPLQAFAPTFQCGCYYDAKVSGVTTCQACVASGTCPGSRPACNLGYCEAD
jgi:hypothetical protein